MYFRNIIWVFLLFYISLFSQNKEIKNNSISQDSLFFNSVKTSDSLFQKRHYNDAKLYINNAIQFAEKNFGKSSLELQTAKFKLGKILSFANQPLKAIQQFNAALQINSKNNIAAETYYELAYCYSAINDNIKAISYANIAKSILLNSPNKSLLLDVCVFLNYKYLNNSNPIKTIKGIENGLLADTLSQQISSQKYKYYIKVNLGSHYNQNWNLDINTSFKYYKEALAIAKQKKDTTKITETYLFLSNLFNTSDFKKSLFYNKKALEICSKNDSLNLSKIHYYNSLTHILAEKYKKSIALSHQSLAYLIGTNLKGGLDKKYIINSNYKSLLLEMIPVLAESYVRLYKKTNNVLFLNKSIALFKLADYTIDISKNNNREYKSKLFWRKLSTDVYSKAIRACYLKKDVNGLFYFMEKNKALLLMEDISNQKYKQTLKIPNNSLLKENLLKRAILILKNSIETGENKTILQKELVDKNRELLTFQDSIYKTNMPLFEAKISSLQDIQNKCKKNEVIVEYHISMDTNFGIYKNNQSAYIFVLTKEYAHCYKIKNQLKLKKNVLQLIQLVKNPFETQIDIDHFSSLSYLVFNELFPNNKVKSLIKNKKLTIVTDSYLALLPFETLNINTDNLKYLITQNEISYLYSNSFTENQNISTSNNSRFLGFAPLQFNYDSLLNLPNSSKEISTAEKYFNGSVFFKDNATKSSFLNQLPNYDIIHLATHANAQDSIQPWIAFNDKKLHLEELYLTKNKASLVVLSGCNTTLGKEETGEGIMSLTRGFFYAGSQSIISSLWSVDDKSTLHIMNQLYRNLSHGQTKSEALHHAKLHYLKNHALPESSPHYWAPFILLGKNNSVISSGTSWYFYGISLSILLLLFLFYRFYKYKKA